MKKLIRIAPWILFFAAFFYVILYIFCFIERDAIFYKADKVGEILYNLSLSVIAATFFYLIIDFFPRRARKRKLLTHLDLHVSAISKEVARIVACIPFTDQSKVPSIDNIDFVQLEENFKKTPINHLISPLLKTPKAKDMRVLQFIKYRSQKIKEEARNLQFDKENYSTELYILLLKIKDARFHSNVKTTLKYWKSKGEFETIEANLGRLFPDFKNLIIDIRTFNEEWKKHPVKRKKDK